MTDLNPQKISEEGIAARGRVFARTYGDHGGSDDHAAASKHDCEYRIEADCALREVDALELKVGLLREGLGKVIAQAEPRDWESRGHPMNEWTKREPILRIAREALDASS